MFKNQQWKIGFGILLIGIAGLIGEFLNKDYFFPGLLINIGLSFMGGTFIAEGWWYMRRPLDDL